MTKIDFWPMKKQKASDIKKDGNSKWSDKTEAIIFIKLIYFLKIF